MKTFSIFIFVLIPLLVFSQKDTSYFFKVNGEPGSAREWEIRKIIDHRTQSKIKVTTYQKDGINGKLLFTEKITVRKDNIYEIKVKGEVFSNAVIRKFENLENGLIKFTDSQNRVIKRVGFTRSNIPLIIEGELTEYYKNGNIKSISVYKNNELISNKNWLENGEVYIDNIFYSVEEDPLFPSGMGRMHSHILNTFKNSGLDLTQISGSIKIGFVVMENGRLDGIKIVEGISQTIDNLALQAFHTLLEEWIPAKLNGKNVRCFQLFPINFIIQEYEYDYVEMRGSMLYWEIN